MCVMLGPEVVIKNAFVAGGNKSLWMDFKDIRMFCDILYNNITQKRKKDVAYTYVYFALDNSSIDTFYKSERGKFFGAGRRIFSMEPVDDASLQEVNSIYDDTVIQAIEEARKKFADQTLTRG